jgi:hypothetical protein
MKARFVASVLAFAMFTASLPAHANGTEDARSHFTRAVELFKEGDFRAALIEFQRAYDAAPNYKVLYNLGQTSLELQDYASALKAFRGYLDGGGKDISPQRRAQVEGDLKKLESRIARVEITVNVEGADVTIDDVSVGKSPLREPVLVSEGRRKIAATKAGLTPTTRVIDVAGGDRPKVSLELVEPPSPQVITVTQPANHEGGTQQVVAPQPPAPTVRTTTGPSTAFWVGVSITGVLAVGTGVLGALALSAKNTFDSRVSQVGVTTAQVDDARNQTRAFALATDITGGVAIAAAITTIVLAFTTHSTHVVRESKQPRFFFGPGGFGLAGTM